MFYVLTTKESGAKILRQYMQSSPLVAKASVRSKAVVWLLMIYCLMYFPLFVRVLCLSFLGMHNFVSFLVLQSSESGLLTFYCLTDVLLL